MVERGLCKPEVVGSNPIVSPTSKMFGRSTVAVHDIEALKSVLDIEDVTKSLIERRPLNDAKLGALRDEAHYQFGSNLQQSHQRTAGVKMVTLVSVRAVSDRMRPTTLDPAPGFPAPFAITFPTKLDPAPPPKAPVETQ